MTVPLQWLLTAISNVIKSLLVTTEIASYVVEPLLFYILSVVGFAVLKCNATILKALKITIKTANLKRQ